MGMKVFLSLVALAVIVFAVTIPPEVQMAAESGDRYVFMWTLLEGREHSVSLPTGFVITGMNFLAPKDYARPELSFEVLGDVQEPAESPVYKYVSIGTKNMDGEEEVLYFKVPVSWIEENNVDKDLVSLEGFREGWEPLRTEYLSETEEEVFYRADNPGYQLLAVTGNVVSFDSREYCGDSLCGMGETRLNCPADCDVPESCGSGERRCANDILQVCIGESWTIREACPYGCSASLECSPYPYLAEGERELLTAAGLIGLAVAVLGSMVIMQRRRKLGSSSQVWKTHRPY